MYYSAGNFEAFAHPRKPEGIENKSAYIIGTGLAALTSAFYLVRDAQMPGRNIHVFGKTCCRVVRSTARSSRAKAM